jgi:hypothetical protein
VLGIKEEAAYSRTGITHGRQLDHGGMRGVGKK